MDSLSVRKKVSERIRAERIKAGYSNYDSLAYDTGLSRQTVWRAETGGNITIDTIVIICRQLKIPVSKIFKGIE
jgi:transcriptional regulator with XRE-family HTH domain